MSDRRSNVSGEGATHRRSSVTREEPVYPSTRGAVAQVRLDDCGHVQSWNQVAADLLGYETAAVIDTPIAELLEEDVGEEWVDDALERAARRGQIVEDVRHVRSDGTRIEATVTISVTREADGDSSGYLYSVRTTDEDVSAEEPIDRHRRLRMFFEKSPDSLFVHDSDGEILEVNDQTVVDLGYSREELLSMNVTDFDVGLDASELREIWDEMEPGSRKKGESEHRRKDGTTFPVEVWVRKLDHGDEPQFLALGRDVTERKERERNVRRRRAFLENTSDIVILLDENGVVQYQNHSMEHLRYPALPETVGEKAVKYVHPEDRGKMKEALDAILEEPGTPVRNELRVQARNGEWRWLEQQSVNLLDDPAVGGILVSSRDVTDRKQYERALKEERDSLQSIIESLPYPFYVMDVEDYSVEYVNSQADIQVGETCYEITHRRDRPCDEGEDAVACPIREIRKTGEPTTVEHVHHDDSGDEQIFEVYATPIYDDEGDVKWVAESAIDVTERHEYERQLESHRDYLERIRNVSEGIRPLNRALARASTRDEIISIVSETLAETDTYRLAWFGNYDPLAERVTPESWAGFDDGFLEDLEIPIDDDESARGPIIRAIRSQEVYADRDIATDPSIAPWRDSALERGFRSAAAIPVLIEGNVHGVIAVYSNRKNAFDTYERELLGELGERVGHAIQAADRRRLLQTDAAQQLVFRTTDDRSPFVAVSERHDCRLELQSVIPTTGSAYIGYMIVDGAPPEAVADFFETADSIEKTRVISSDGDTGRMEYTVSSSPVMKLLEFDVSVSSAVIEDGEEIVHGEVAPDVATQPIVAGMQSAYDGVELVAKRSVDRYAKTPQSLVETINDALTDRQREILTLAFQAGYFESPRQSTGEELAETIGIAAPTFYVHVRRGTRNLLEQLDGFEILE